MKTHGEQVKDGQSVKQTGPQQNKDLKTDRPLSEKDEVKNAETRTRKALKHYL
jgi:hypothetical protein